MTSGPSSTVPESAFLEECRTFLAARYSRRREAESGFSWGIGSDRAAVWEEVDQAADRDEVSRVRRWRRLLWENGLGWITGPVALGGRGLPDAYQRIFDVIARSYDVPGNGKLVVSLGMVAPTILAHGTAGAKDRYLARLYSGDLIACQLFSEPVAGSDLAGVATQARRDGDGWRITGQKVWTSGAHYADIGEILCKTGSDERHRNLTAFVVDLRAPGVEVRGLRQMTGGAAFNEVFLTDVWVPDDDRLGEVNGGWGVALTTLANERKAIGGAGFGGAGLLSVERYRQMVAALGLADDPLVRQRVADLAVHFRIAKYTRERVAARERAGHAPGPEASIGKLQLAQNYLRLSEFVSAVLGPRLVADTGVWGTYAWAEFVLGAPGIRLGGGTDEVLKNVIAERMLGLPKR